MQINAVYLYFWVVGHKTNNREYIGSLTFWQA